MSKSKKKKFDNCKLKPVKVHFSQLQQHDMQKMTNVTD